MFIDGFSYIYGMKLLKSVRVAHKVVQVSATTQENFVHQYQRLILYRYERKQKMGGNDSPGKEKGEV